MSNGIRFEEYSTGEIVCLGKTFNIKDDLKAMGARFKKDTRDGPGWVFPSSARAAIEVYKSSGKVTSPDDAASLPLSSQQLEMLQPRLLYPWIPSRPGAIQSHPDALSSV